MKKLLFISLLIISISGNPVFPVFDCKIIHPEKAIFDYQLTPADKKDWFIIRKDPNRVSLVQQDYLMRKLLLSNHQYPFSDNKIYSSDMAEEWKKLHAKYLKFFRNKTVSKELLVLVQVELGDNFWRGHFSSEALPLTTDEYFVFPVSALESYEWPKGKIENYYLNNNDIEDIVVMGPQRASRYSRFTYDSRNIRLDPDTFSNANREALRKFCNNDDFYQEILYMGSLKNTYHDLIYGGKRINLVTESSDWKAHDALVTYSIGSFPLSNGKDITVMVAPFSENDINDNMGPYRGSTNHRDCYYFVESASIDYIGPGDELPKILARLLIAADTDFKGLEVPKRGYFERLKGFTSLGKYTADGYPFGLITDDNTLYFLNTGLINDYDAAMDQYKLVIKQLDNIEIPFVGKLEKGPEDEGKNSEGIQTKNQFYSIHKGSDNYAILAVYYRFTDDFYLCGIEVFKVKE